MPATLSPPLKVAEIRSRIEPDLKKEATRVLASCGLNVSDAIRLFLRQVVAQNGLPFEVKMPNATTRAAMAEADTGKLPRFASVQELLDDLEKDGEESTRLSADLQTGRRRRGRAGDIRADGDAR